MVFQPRDMGSEAWKKERHIAELAKAVQREGTLDKISVFPCAGRYIIVDGHCRVEAYRKAGWTSGDMVPAVILKGTLGDALKEAAAANSKDKLSVTTTEKAEYAWKLVVFFEGNEATLRDLRAWRASASLSSGTCERSCGTIRRELGMTLTLP